MYGSSVQSADQKKQEIGGSLQKQQSGGLRLRSAKMAAKEVSKGRVWDTQILGLSENSRKFSQEFSCRKILEKNRHHMLIHMNINMT